MTVLKPYLALACAAFMVGFVGYWMVGKAIRTGAAASASGYEAAVAVPARADDFDPGKRI